MENSFRKDEEMRTAFEYDAFVIYNPERTDLHFVKEMADQMENSPYNMKLYIPWRDDEGNDVDLVTMATIIENRCRKCIVVLSRSFQCNEVANHQLRHAHCVSPGNRLRKIIPVSIEDCEVPNYIKHITKIDFKSIKPEWCWPRLHGALLFRDSRSLEKQIPDLVSMETVLQDTKFQITEDGMSRSLMQNEERTETVTVPDILSRDNFALPDLIPMSSADFARGFWKKHNKHK